MIGLLFAALLPAIVLLVYVYSKDKAEKEPIGLVVRLFILGAVAGPLAAIVEGLAFDFFDTVLGEGAFALIIKYFVGVAAVEEGFKYLFLSTVRKNPEFNYVFDGVVYAVAVALGFAALENVMYVFDGGMEVAVTRAIFSVPGHCADGVVMGCFFGLARQREVAGNKSGARTYYWLAFLLPVIEHGFYDTALSTESEGLYLLALAVELAFIVFAMILVNRISKTDSPIFQTYKNNGFQAMQQARQQQPYSPQQYQQPYSPQQYQQHPYQPQQQSGQWQQPQAGQWQQSQQPQQQQPGQWQQPQQQSDQWPQSGNSPRQ